MTEREELENILKLIKKYNLPLSPILEYAIMEKIEEYPEPMVINAQDDFQGDNKILSSLETSNIEQVGLSQIEDEQFPMIKGYSIENQGNHCYIIDSSGEKLFSSSGKLINIGEEFYRINYTYSSISINIVRKDERDVYVLGKRILNAKFRTPLYAALDEQEYLEQIKAVRYDKSNEEYHILVGNRWYGGSGYYADLGQDENNAITRNDITIKEKPVIISNELRIVDFGEHKIAVIGDTKSHKDSLRAMGGYFMISTPWGPAWSFPNKKRERVQAYIDGNTSVVDSWEDRSHEESRKKKSSRYIIRVKYPNGSEFISNNVWETLVDVVNYAGAIRVKQLNIICMGDNLVSSRLNDNQLYRSAQKSIGRGLYVCTYSSTDVKYKQIERINQELHLGLIVEKVYVDENGNKKVKIDNEPYKWKELTSSSHDRTKYSFEGGQMLNKRRFVLEVVKYYVRCHPHISYESLIRVFPSTLHSNKSNGVIKRYDDVAKQIVHNSDVRNRFFLKDDEIIELSNGMKVVVHNQWGNDFDNFLKVAEGLYDVKSNSVNFFPSSDGISKESTQNNTKSLENEEDKRIGYTVRLFPSQLKGEIVRVRIDEKGYKKLVVRSFNGKTVEIDDLPYLYEVLKR